METTPVRLIVWVGTVTGVVGADPFPSCPLLSSPQPQMVPSDRRARLQYAPAEMAVMPVRPETRATAPGVEDADPFPSCPRVLSPQTKTSPSFRSAKAWEVPAEIATMFERPATGCGTGAFAGVVAPVPSSPSPLAPQTQTVPSWVSARLKLPPAAMATAFVRLSTGAGTIVATEPPVPSWNPKSLPQAQTVPSLASARSWVAPEDMAV